MPFKLRKYVNFFSFEQIFVKLTSRIVVVENRESKIVLSFLPTMF